MAENPDRSYRPDFVTPPGDTLRETIDAWGLTQTDVAERTGKTTKSINEIVQGKCAITAETALQLERVLGVPAGFWLTREARYQEYRARAAASASTARDAGWARGFPLRAMERRGWLPATKGTAAQVDALLGFFGVATVQAWDEVWGGVTARLRKAAAFEPDRKALLAWLRRGEHVARTVEAGSWDPSGFANVLQTVRSLTAEPFDRSTARLASLCSAVGVVVVVEPELPKTRVLGATRWIAPSRALVQLSLRYRTEDHFWFTFFHEAGHILRHGKKALFIEDGTPRSPEEDEADRFAADCLVPTRPLERFRRTWRGDRQSLVEFAGAQGIAPGILVGRLQHDGTIPRSRFNELRRRIREPRVEG